MFFNSMNFSPYFNHLTLTLYFFSFRSISWAIWLGNINIVQIVWIKFQLFFWDYQLNPLIILKINLHLVFMSVSNVLIGLRAENRLNIFVKISRGQKLFAVWAIFFISKTLSWLLNYWQKTWWFDLLFKFN